MAQYIDKDMLLKAIEVKRNGLIALMNQIPYASNYPIWSSNVDLLDEVKRGIDILEVKGVDLEKEYKGFIKVDYNEFEKLFDDFCKSSKGNHVTSHDACMWFWELGLKSQKGE